MSTQHAIVVNLSPSTRAVIVTTPSGRLGPVTFLRGQGGFTLSDSEARKLAAAVEDKAA